MRATIHIPLLLVALSSLGAHAQAQSSQAGVSAPPVIANLLRGPAPDGCPVNFAVNRVPQGAVVWTGSQVQRRPTQGVDLNFRSPSGLQIVKADVILHGVSGALRVMPAADNTTSDLTETFVLERDTDTPALIARELKMKSIAIVNWVELTRIEFADGVVWNKSSSSTCIASPSGLLRVSGR
jgi:hypothetical protein